MAIISANIEAQGWVLKLVFSGTLGTFASYTLDPDGAPRVSVRATHAGFTKSAGEAIATTAQRTIVATKPLRKPVDIATPTVAVLDEVDLGSGFIQVRIALSREVYATDTAVALDVLAGWRAGEAAATGITVTNDSTVAAPIPIMRWALLPDRNAPATFRLSLIVASHHPSGLEPVAGVKFTATDGTTVKTVWATELGTDNTHGDNLRCYTALIDPTTATALTAGVLRCDATAYPWLGALRSTDPTNAKSMVDVAGWGVGGAGGTLLSGAENPTTVVHDPAGTLFGSRWLFVDPAGTVTAAAAMVKATLAEAKALPLGERPANIKCALQALYLNNRTRAAANGQAALARSAENANIVIAAGVVVTEGTSVTSGLATNIAPVRIMGDPDNADPRVNCIIRTGTANAASWQATRFHYSDLTFETGQAALFAYSTLGTIERVTLRGKSGFTSSTTLLHGSAPSNGRWNFAAADIRFTDYGGDLGGNSNERYTLVRKAVTSRPIGAVTVLGAQFITTSGLASDATSSTLIRGFIGLSDPSGCQDSFTAYCDLRACKERVWTPSVIASASSGVSLGGTAVGLLSRVVFMGNTVERYGSSVQPLFSAGEGVQISIRDVIIEGNTVAGERFNFFYNDPPSATATSELVRCRVANNSMSFHANKHDTFLSPTYGYRPAMITMWASLYGVNWEGNYDQRQHYSIGSGDFRNEFYGLRSFQSPTAVSGSLLFTADASRNGTGLGYGDYSVIPGSPLLNRIGSSNTDRDRAGAAKVLLGAAGAVASAVAAVIATVRRLLLLGVG
jgi:hypothetical protein